MAIEITDEQRSAAMTVIDQLTLDVARILIEGRKAPETRGAGIRKLTEAKVAAIDALIATLTPAPAPVRSGLVSDAACYDAGGGG